MVDFEQPTGYLFIDDGRLPEEQPGMPFITPHGMRITGEALAALAAPDIGTPTNTTKLTPEQEIEANRHAVNALVAAEKAIATTLPFSRRLKMIADKMCERGFANSLIQE